jgi:hypothetical protein
MQVSVDAAIASPVVMSPLIGSGAKREQRRGSNKNGVYRQIYPIAMPSQIVEPGLSGGTPSPAEGGVGRGWPALRVARERWVPLQVCGG